MSKVILGYINLYPDGFYGTDYLHWAGSLHKTKKEALKYKDKGKNHFIGVVYKEDEDNG